MSSILVLVYWVFPMCQILFCVFYMKFFWVNLQKKPYEIDLTDEETKARSDKMCAQVT